jgi:hypothetical protein
VATGRGTEPQEQAPVSPSDQTLACLIQIRNNSLVLQ